MFFHESRPASISHEAVFESHMSEATEGVAPSLGTGEFPLDRSGRVIETLPRKMHRLKMSRKSLGRD